MLISHLNRNYWRLLRFFFHFILSSKTTKMNTMHLIPNANGVKKKEMLIKFFD